MAAKTPDPEMGARYGRLVVVAVAEGRGKYKHFRVVCDCGQSKEVYKRCLVSGGTRSCGCLNRGLSSERLRTHGMVDTTTYSRWLHMKDRCNNPSAINYENYGGRGISVCERWLSFENFYSDMGDPPPNTSLDRIDTNGNYELGNCRWADAKTQADNKRSSVRFLVFGESLSLREAAEKYSISRVALKTRVYRNGLSVEEAVSRPVLSPQEYGAMAGSGGWGRTNKRIDGTKLYASNPESAL